MAKAMLLPTFSPHTAGKASSQPLSVTKCKTSSRVASRSLPLLPFSKISMAKRFWARVMEFSNDSNALCLLSCSCSEAKRTIVAIWAGEFPFKAVNTSGWSTFPSSSLSRNSASMFAVWRVFASETPEVASTRRPKTSTHLSKTVLLAAISEGKDAES